jgi:hypothetical protein
VLELAGGEEAPVVTRASVEVGATDCLIGERMWRDRSWMWNGER